MGKTVPKLVGSAVASRAQLFLPEGQSAEVKYVVEWKQERGRVEVATDIWNMNAGTMEDSSWDRTRIPVL
jgi:hypothetical protein